MKKFFNTIYQKTYFYLFPSTSHHKADYPTYQTRVNDISINYAKIGKGPNLVFVHGWTNNWEGWIPIVKYLEKDFTLYLVDMPGFGDSGNLPCYSVNTCADYIVAFIEKLHLRPEAVVGVSMGSFVVADIGSRYPQITKDCILTGCVVRDGHLRVLTEACDLLLRTVRHSSLAETVLKKIIETKMAAYFLAKYMNMYRFDKEMVDKYGMIGKKKIRKVAYVEIGISAASYKLKDTLKKMKIPTLLVLGENDKYTDYRYVAKNIIPHNELLKLVAVEEAGHVVPWEKPKEVAESINTFLSSR